MLRVVLFPSDGGSHGITMSRGCSSSVNARHFIEQYSVFLADRFGNQETAAFLLNTALLGESVRNYFQCYVPVDRNCAHLL